VHSKELHVGETGHPVAATAKQVHQKDALLSPQALEAMEAQQTSQWWMIAGSFLWK